MLQNGWAKWNKPDPERQTLYDLIYVESRKAKLIETE
jgi:hypothetical protein